LSQEPVVEAVELTKTYDSITAVDKLSLRIEEGEIFGFLGPNGSGKTTSILMFLGLTEPTSGTARIFGYNSTREPLKVKSIAGYVPENVGFYDDLSVGYNLAYTARLSDIPEEIISQRMEAALETVGLKGEVKRKVGEFSRGMKQRLAIADVLMKMPKIVFLDEPTAGIDPKGIRQTLDLISRIAKENNMTVIMSSHQLSQVQRICSNVGIMQKGKLVVQGLIDQLGRESLGGGRFKIEVRLAEVTAAIVEAIKEVKGVLKVEKPEKDLLLISSKEDIRPQVAKVIVDNNGLLEQMNIVSYALEDIYMKYSSEG